VELLLEALWYDWTDACPLGPLEDDLEYIDILLGTVLRVAVLVSL
jgi:hypothetical protein